MSWGFTAEGISSAQSRVTAKLEVAQRVHEGQVTCLCASSRYLCSGGVDESVRVFDLRTRRSVGVLQQHSSTVNCMAMVPPGKVLLTGGEEGNIIVWRCGDWVSQLVMRGHKGGVVALASHPSGRLALSLGKDSTLRLWDLTKGRQVHSQGIPANSRGAQWSKDGSKFFIHYDTQVGVYNGEDGSELVALIPPPGRGMGGLSSAPRINTLKLLAFSPSQGEFIAVGCEGGDVIVWDVKLCGSGVSPPSPGVLATGHDIRVRELGLVHLEKVTHDGSGVSKNPGFSNHDSTPSSIDGLAKLSCEEVAFNMGGECGVWLLATVGANGVTKLWDGEKLFLEAQSKNAQICSAKANTNKGERGPPFFLLTGTLLGNLDAARNTRPTVCI